MEELGRWAVGTVHRRLNRVLPQQHQSNWDQGRLRLRAQEEAAKLWAKEGVQSLGIACWQVSVLGVLHRVLGVLHMV